MGKAMNIGVANVARKGKAGYIGVANVARKIKKAWVGDANGVAREFFNSVDKLVVYSATYTGSEILTLSSVDTKNTDYVASTAEHKITSGYGENPPYSTSGTQTILSLNALAKTDFAYADVVVGIAYSSSYGDFSIALNSVTKKSATYNASSGNEDVTLTLALSNASTVSSTLSVVNRSSYTGARTIAQAVVKSVTLHN